MTKGARALGAASDGTELERFLAAGAAPVVFTLGSSAVMAAGRFFEESVKAVTKLGMRAVLAGGEDGGASESRERLIYVTDYAPYSELLPRAAATVHQGGIGTVAQALKAGRPTIVVPWAHDQPDNAARCRRLGLARTVRRDNYKWEVVARELDRLLGDRAYASRARELADRLAEEDGLRLRAMLSRFLRTKRRAVRTAPGFAEKAWALRASC